MENTKFKIDTEAITKWNEEQDRINAEIKYYVSTPQYCDWADITSKLNADDAEAFERITGLAAGGGWHIFAVSVL